ncbi:MAG: hypothetical protein K8F29_02385 [Kofleriaceae bacterium]|nr:hypothetical protein [Candidatus Methylomirabilis lanthanidiphila]
MIGYSIGENVVGTILDFYFAGVGANRSNILHTFALLGAFLCTYGWWSCRRLELASTGKERLSRTLKSVIETFIAGGVGIVIGYLIGLASVGFIVQLVEETYFPERSHIVAFFAVGIAFLAARIGRWR